MRAAVYLRVSTEEQAAEAHSIDAQRRECAAYAQRRGWQIVAEYVDPGVSGRTMTRPGMDRLLADAERGAFDVVVVHKLDRWSRSIRDTITSLDDLERTGVSFAAAAQNIDRTTPEGKLLMMLLAVFAETYIDNLRQETTKGKRERALKGLYNGSLVFGYERAPRVAGQPPQPPHPHPVAGPAVRELFARAAQGASPRELADWLNQSGFRTSGVWGERLFGTAAVTYILRNRFYLGEVSYKGEWRRGQHEPLTTPGAFNAVAAAIARRRTSRGVTHKARSYPLRGLLVCQKCRQSFRGWARSDGQRFYRDTAHLKGVTCPHRVTYRAELLEGQIAEWVANLRLPGDWRAQIEAMLFDNTAQDVEAQRRRLLERRRREQALFLSGDIDDAEYARRKARTETELAALQPVETKTYTAGVAALKDFKRIWKAATDAEREELLHAIVERVYVENGSLVAVEPREPFYPLLVVSSGVSSASDGRQTAIRHHRVQLLPPKAWRRK